MMTLLPFDELNRLRQTLNDNQYIDVNTGKRRFLLTNEEIENEILDLFVLAYYNGSIIVSEKFDIETEVDPNNVNMAIYKEIAGKTWDQRVREHLENGDSIDDILLVADTEMHRDYETGKYDRASNTGFDVNKTWITVLDGKERDTHFILDGTTVPLNERFYSVSGDSALFPGGFESAEENANCRCTVEYSRARERA